MEYSRIFGSTFPNGVESVIPEGNKKDIDDTVYELIKQYYEYIDSGNLAEATELYNTNKVLLEPYSVSSLDYNRWKEELYNLGVAILNNSSTIHDNEEPATQTTNSHWLVEY